MLHACHSMEVRQAVECGQIQHNECRDRKERGRGGESMEERTNTGFIRLDFQRE